MRGLFDADESASSSVSGSTSDNSGSSVFFCTKGPSSILRNPEKKSPIQLSIASTVWRMKSAQRAPMESTHGGSGSSDCESSVNPRGGRHRLSPKTFKRETNSITVNWDGS